MEFYQVKLSSVAFVLAEAILRKTRAEVAHNRVARDLRDHARGRDGQAVAIAVDDGGLRQGKGAHREPIDEDVLGLSSETLEGEPHRLVGCAQDIDRVDLDGIDDSDRPADRVVRDDIRVNLLPFLRQQLFRIVQLLVPKLFRENDHCGYDWTGEGTAAGFIDAGDGGDSQRAEFAFVAKSAASIHRHAR